MSQVLKNLASIPATGLVSLKVQKVQVSFQCREWWKNRGEKEQQEFSNFSANFFVFFSITDVESKLTDVSFISRSCNTAKYTETLKKSEWQWSRKIENVYLPVYIHPKA